MIKNIDKLNTICREREREREFLSNNGRRKLLFNFFLNQRGGEGYLIPNISLEVLDYE